jgi:hypothetical protein
MYNTTYKQYTYEILDLGLGRPSRLS